MNGVKGGARCEEMSGVYVVTGGGWGTMVYIPIQVTGGCGFVGSHLVDKLLRDGHEVMSCDISCDYDS